MAAIRCILTCVRTLLLLSLVTLAACSPSESLPTTCSPACAAGQVCVNAQCLAPVDAGADVTADVAAGDAPPDVPQVDVAPTDSGVDVPFDTGPRCSPHPSGRPTTFCENPEPGCYFLDDERHCGRCDNPCTTGSMCVAGACVTPDAGADAARDAGCPAGFADCDGNPANGCEVRLSNGEPDTISADIRHCGRCGVRCSANHAFPTCFEGMCSITCENSAYGNCDNNAANGCESNLRDTNNCGACGVRCLSGQRCAGTPPRCSP